MKKSGEILILLIIFVLLISVVGSVSLVSAGFWEDIWSKITGKVIEENITAKSETAVVEEESCPQIPTSMLCLDEKTLCPQTKDEKGCLVWNCAACEAEPKEDKIICCAITPILEEPVPTRYELRLESQCDPTLTGVSYAKVSEEYCEKKPKAVEELKEEPVPELRPREVGEIEKLAPEPEVCAAKIRVSSNQKVYYVGDNAEIIVEIFDEQGNLLQNYPFYGQTYDGNKWQSPSKESTDREGNFRRAGIIKESDNLFGKVSFKVFTKISGCDSIEDTLEIEIKKIKEKEEVCGIGVCVPEKEEKVEEIPEEKEILYSCAGCELEGKCYPLGYRKARGYCSVGYEFVSQKEEGVCENNFECKSNVCISDECISEGLIKKIIAWFKKVFGKEEPEESEKPEKARICSDLLIEKNIGDYKYNQSRYDGGKDGQAPLYSENGKQIGVVKCCGVLYDKGMAALVCPYDNREDLYYSVKGLSTRGEIYLGEYNGQKVYELTGKKVIVWTNDNYLIGVGTEIDNLLPENIINAYLKKYPNNLAEFLEKIGETPVETIPVKEITKEPVSQPPSRITEEFLDKIKGLGKITLIDFETKPDGTILQVDEKLTGKEWESLGVKFETPSEEYLKVFGPNYPFNPLDKLSLSPGLGPFEDGSETHDDLNIIFTEPVKATGFYLLDLGETDERESIVFLDKNGNVLNKISPWPKSTFGNPAPGTFISFISEKEISKIEIKENTRDSDDIAYDNLYFVK